MLRFPKAVLLASSAIPAFAQCTLDPTQLVNTVANTFTIAKLGLEFAWIVFLCLFIWAEIPALRRIARRIFKHSNGCREFAEGRLTNVR